MERSLSSLTFKGSIPEAIAEAKKQKKLFVVYISGEDTESVNLESTTWTDFKVAESLSKYCVLLHITEGSTEAANFCAIYPQKSIPCITAIGYNGVQLWKSEGFISAEDLASSLEKAWLGLHIQETTATVLTAALASKKSEPPTFGTSVMGSSEHGSSSGTAVRSCSSQKHGQASVPGSSVRSEMPKENETELRVKASSKAVIDNASGSAGDEDSNSSSKATEDSVSTAMANRDSSGAKQRSSSAADSFACADPERNIYHSSLPQVGSEVISSEANEAVQYEKADDTESVKVKTLGNCDRVSELSEVHLNIRLPDGISLREKFSVTSSLRIVKDYVDRNQASGFGPYDLAVPYPRKVFSDEDLNKSLSELSLFDRQALIVVPRQRASGYRGGESSSFAQTISTSNAESSNESAGGYFSFIKTILSYANPFSYFSSGASSSGSEQNSQTGIWEYGPNPALRNNLARSERNDGTSSTRSDSKSRPLTTSHFGSNIHTLRHDEDDDRFNDRNAFWNGNSTQYGGDSNSR